MTGLVVQSASSALKDAHAAVAQLAAELGTRSGAYLAFVAPPYDLDTLARALRATWGERVIGCTSAGNIGGHGFEEAPLTVIALTGSGLRLRTLLVEPLDALAAGLASADQELRRWRADVDPDRSFALLLVDGLSRQEEHLAASLGTALAGLPLIGGSAGDDLSFERTAVLGVDRFVSNAASVAVLTVDSPFTLFRVQHVEPTDAVLVITDASPAERIVHTINGMPATEAYAQAIGVGVADLNTGLFSAHPVVLRAGGSHWVRSVSSILPGGALQFFAAVDTGAVLRLATSVDPVDAVRASLDALQADLGPLAGVIAFDCILRRVALRGAGLLDQVGACLQSVGAAGFSTYGEQFGDFHMNQTMVGVAFGAAPQPGVPDERGRRHPRER